MTGAYYFENPIIGIEFFIIIEIVVIVSMTYLLEYYAQQN